MNVILLNVMCVHACSAVSSSATPWTIALQAPPSMGFSRQDCWSGCNFLLQGIFPTQGLNLSLLWQVDSLPLSHMGNPYLMWKWSEVAQSCLTLSDSMDCSPPGSLVHGIFQAWILEWVAISYCRRSSRPRDWICVSCVSYISRILYCWATREAPFNSCMFPVRIISGIEFPWA